MKQNKVTANFSQNYDTDEKAQARENIGAASTATATQSSDGLMSSQDKIRLDNIQAPVQSDWTVTNTESLAYIQHKPENLVQDADYVHTDNNFTDAEKTKLAGIEDGAEVNVQANWTQSDSTADDYIKNKPGIPAMFNAMRSATDSTSAPRYVKVAELTPSISSDYIYHYDLSFLVTGSTGRGDGEKGESGQFDLNITCRKNSNVYYANGVWSNFDGVDDLTSSYRNVESVILMEQFKDNSPSADDLTKVEVWLKVTNNLNYMQNLSVSVLVNQGDRQYTSYYPSKTFMNGPWTVTTGAVWLTTTAPTGDSTAPNTYRLTEFQASPTEVAQVNADWNAVSGVAEILNKPNISLVQKLNYGDLNPTNVSTLLIDNDDPEGYSLVKADGGTQGHLIAGPYKTLLDSGINGGAGKGDSTTPLYVNGSGQFAECDPMQKELTAGYRISIGPGANNTTVIANTMHESVVSSCLLWDTLANNYDYDYYWGNWRVHVHLQAFSDWTQNDGAIHIRINHAYAAEAAQKIKCGSYQIQNFFPYKNGNSYDFTNSHWVYDGADPYTTATTPDPYGFTFHLMNTTPTRQMPDTQAAHRFLVDTGAPYGEWLELDASVRFLVPNAQPSGNAIYLLFKAKYAYPYT